MKRFAYRHEKGNYIKTNVWEVREWKKSDPHKLETVTFFSTHRRIENRRELVFVNKRPNAYFKYKNLNQIVTHEGYEETLTHEICKEILSDYKTITFRVGNENYTIYVSDCEVEQEIKTPNGSYYVDLLYKFEKSEPEWLATKWNGVVSVEVYVTHKTSDIKKKDLLDMGIPVIEFKVSDKFYIDETKKITEEEVMEKKRFISKFYQKEIYAKIISDPSSEEYINMLEIEELKKQISSLEKQISIKNSEFQQSSQQITLLRNEKLALNNQILERDRMLLILKFDNEEFKKSFWYKLYRIFCEVSRT